MEYFHIISGNMSIPVLLMTFNRYSLILDAQDHSSLSKTLESIHNKINNMILENKAHHIIQLHRSLKYLIDEIGPRLQRLAVKKFKNNDAALEEGILSLTGKKIAEYFNEANRSLSESCPTHFQPSVTLKHISDHLDKEIQLRFSKKKTHKKKELPIIQSCVNVSTLKRQLKKNTSSH